MIKSFEDLEVYQLSYSVANEIFLLTRDFPKEELYSLTSQIVRSSRSISSNIAEGWAKRTYENKFKLQLIDSSGSTAETKNWIRFAKDCGYVSQTTYSDYCQKLDQIGKMLTKLHQNWKTFKSSESILQPPISNV